MISRFVLYILVLGLIFGSAGCETVPTTPGTPRDLKTLCEQYNIQWNIDSVSQAITLRAAGREAKALVGSSVVIVNGERVYLTDIVRRDRGAVIVSGDFVAKVIQRLISAGVARPGFHIIVDAGHGGKDPGAIGRSGLQEKDVNLDISRRLKAALEARGFKVTMTRNQDVFIPLEERTEIATRAKADLFVSIHANANPSRNIDGLEVYTLRELEPLEKRDPQRMKNHRILYQGLAMKSGNADLEEILSDMMFQHKRDESDLLASYVNKGISLGARVNSRGVMRAGFHVLRNTLIPAVLVEVGYLSNSHDEALLRQPEHRQKVADSIASSLLSFSAR